MPNNFVHLFDDPYPHLLPMPSGHKGLNAWRVPVQVLMGKDTYIVCVGQQQYRYFNDKTVPREIKSLLAMVNAFPVEDRTVNSAHWAALYVAPHVLLEDIGWQIFDGLYMLMLPVKVFERIQLKGEDHGQDT